MDRESLRLLVRGYTYEAGVRELSRRLDAVFRKLALRTAQGRPAITQVTPAVIRDLLGPEPTQKDFSEAVLRAQSQAAGLDWDIASCGTGDWHVGRGADPRSCASAQRRGYSLAAHRARQLCAADYRHYDWLLAADRSNLAEIRRRRPADATAQMALALGYAGLAQPVEVPDPYYGSDAGFDAVIDLAEAFARAVIAAPRA